MLSRVRMFVTVLALSIPSLAAAGDGTSVYLKTPKYTYCDAKLLSSLWKVSVDEAMNTAGAKIYNKQTKDLDAALADARKNAATDKSARCSFYQAGFSYADAEKLAKLWKVSIADAKARAEDKIIAGKEKALRSAAKPTGTEGSVNEEATATYRNQDKYGGCEVKLVAKYWHQPAKKVEQQIGLALQSKTTDTIDAAIAEARTEKGARCTAADAGFTPWDVERLAKLFGQSVKDATSTIESKLLAGNTSVLREVLRNEQPTPADVTAFTAQTKYTYCDAVMIGTLWHRTAEHAKAFIGAKLTAKNTRAIDAMLKTARANAVANVGARCDYSDAGIRHDDLETLAKLWKLGTPSEAKAEASLRIAKGQEAAIKKQLATEAAKSK